MAAQPAVFGTDGGFEALFRTMALGVVYQDAAGAIIMANPAAERILGLTLAEMQGRTSIDPRWRSIHVDGSDFPGDEHPAMQALREGRPVCGTIMGVFHPRQNDWRWILIDAVPEFRPGETRPFRVYTTFNDITELRQTERQLAEINRTLEERVRQRTAEVEELYNLAPCGYHSLDHRGCITRINDTELQWLGYTRAEILGRPFSELLSPASLAIFQASFPEFRSRGWVRDLEFELIRKDGSALPVVVSATAQYDADGHYLASRSSVFDDSERRKIAEALHESEATYRDLFEGANDGIFIIDSQDGHILRANPSGLRILAVDSFDALQGKSVNDFILPEDGDDAARRAERLRAGEVIAPYERRMRRQDGKLVYVEINIALIRNHAGQPKWFQSAIRDVTARKLAEQALQESEMRLRQSRDALGAAYAELEIAARLKDEFLAMTSHELRTPLTGILGLAEILLDQIRGPLNEAQQKYVSMIESSGQRLLELINHMIDLSHVQAGKLESAPVVFDTDPLCEECIENIHEKAQRQKLHLTFVSNPPGQRVYADPRWVRQILHNLLDNAVKFTPANGSVTLEVQADGARGGVRFSVRDTGIGIAAEHMARLFQPFTQVDTGLDRPYEGAGLGLVLVKKLTEQQGGTVEVQSQPGVGSCFSVILPRQKA